MLVPMAVGTAGAAADPEEIGAAVVGIKVLLSRKSRPHGGSSKEELLFLFRLSFRHPFGQMPDPVQKT